MALKLLTDLKIRNAKAREGEYLLGDGGGLFLRVRTTGKDWIFRYSIDGKRRKQGLGSYPDVSLERARSKASEGRSAVSDGLDAIDTNRAAIEEKKVEEAAKMARHTVRMLFDEWHQRDASQLKDGGNEIKRAFEKDVLPVLGDFYAEELSRRDIMKVLDAVKKRGVTRYLNVLLQYLRQMFKFAMTREITKIDPTFGIDKKDAGGRERERERVLAEKELRHLAVRLPASGLSTAAQSAFWLMLATACRVGELSRAQWEHIDLKAGVWIVPKENAKNKREHLIHLSSFAIRHFETVSAQSLSKSWFLPNRDDSGHIDTKSIQKQFRDRQRAKAMKNRSKKLGALGLSGGEWTAHDLRRTAATMMGELGVRSDVIDRALNHVDSSKVTRIYQRQELLLERAQAFKCLGDQLQLISGGSDSQKVS